MAPPTVAVEQFRLGKLYADRARAADAERWFEKAVDGLAMSGNATHRPYLDWAARWLGKRAIEDELFETAAKQFTHVCTGNAATLEDFDNLALASLMIGDYTAAAKASQQGLRMDPEDANRYRYGAALAQLASRTRDIPISPDGERGWDEIGREELDTLLRQQAQIVREVQAEFKELDRPSPERKQAATARITAAQSLFVGAALESVRRGINLREAAFFGGYAPLIFYAREWKLRPTPGPQRKQTIQRQAEKQD